MSVIVLLILASIAVAAGFLGLFLWAVKDGQYDDDTTPAIRILFDEPGADGRRAKRRPGADGSPG